MKTAIAISRREIAPLSFHWRSAPLDGRPHAKLLPNSGGQPLAQKSKPNNRPPGVGAAPSVFLLPPLTDTADRSVA